MCFVRLCFSIDVHSYLGASLLPVRCVLNLAMDVSGVLIGVFVGPVGGVYSNNHSETVLHLSYPAFQRQ